MKIEKLIVPLTILACTGGTLLFANAVIREFAPPRTAVIDIKKVFDAYEKKKVLEGDLLKEAAAAQEKLKNLQTRLKNVEDELKVTQQGTDDYEKLILKRTEIQLEASKLQREKLKEFEDKHKKAVGAIREEIISEIERYATAHQLDLVLENTFSADGTGAPNSPSLSWPIVHYVKPEINISEEIIKILNSRYKKVPR